MNFEILQAGTYLAFSEKTVPFRKHFPAGWFTYMGNTLRILPRAALGATRFSGVKCFDAEGIEAISRGVERVKAKRYPRFG
jgi:hypothetical protein